MKILSIELGYPKLLVGNIELVRVMEGEALRDWNGGTELVLSVRVALCDMHPATE